MFPAIIILCLLAIPVFYRTKKYNRDFGIVLIFIGLSALMLRMIAVRQYPLLGVLNINTAGLSFLIVSVPVCVLIIACLMFSKILRGRKQYVLRLLPLYIFWGAFQQMFFLWVVTDAFFYLTGSIQSAYVCSVLYFFTIHLKPGKKMRERKQIFYTFLVLGFSLINTYVYLYLNNALPQMLLHGVAGTVLFASINPWDGLAQRLG